MYESMTSDVILDKLLSNVPDSIDKREGSVIYDALAPCSIELAQMYIELDVILNQTFADTATRTYLIKRCAERGITPYAATYVIVKAQFNIEVPIGSRFTHNNYSYKVTEKISDRVYKLQCETVGSSPNGLIGTLIPVDYIEGLTSAVITEILIPGEDEEETETLRARYYNSLSSQSYGGNKADYIEKTNSLDGVGGTKVYPVWNGGGTVKLVIIDSNFKKPTTTLINTVQTVIDPITNSGEGVGLAPIGHTVTVASVEETTVNISTVITYQEGWNFEACKTYITNIVNEYFAELSKSWASENNLIVRISQLETRLLNCAGILDIASTTLNGVAENLVLLANNIPIVGDING